MKKNSIYKQIIPDTNKEHSMSFSQHSLYQSATCLSMYGKKHSVLFQDSTLDFIVSNRHGGISMPPYNSLNIAYHVGDEKVKAAINRSTILRHFYAHKTLLYLNQIHSNHIISIHRHSHTDMFTTNLYAYNTTTKTTCLIDTTILYHQQSHEILLGSADGIICNDRNFIALIMVADCNPILLFCPKKNVFALIHAGRIGMCSLIVTNAINILMQEYNVSPSDILVFVGASIRQCCYEVGYDIASDIIVNFGNKYITQDNMTYKLDMIALLQDELDSMKICKINREILPICTCCDNNYFSYRRDVNTGRFGIFATIL